MSGSSENKRLLAALAHPDDESFGMSGTIARYVNEGADVYLICATNGEAGSTEPKFLEDYESMAELRMAELRCATEILGLKEVFLYGYRDSGMTGSPDNEHPESLYQAELVDVTRKIVKTIREIRPHVVVTFDPYGGYGHPDHVKMHQAADAAFRIAGDAKAYPEQLKQGLAPYQPQKLYYLTRNRGYWKAIVNILPLFKVDPERMGRNGDINVREIVAHTYPIHAKVSTKAVTEQANQARMCHQSQLGGFSQPSLLQRFQRLFMRSNVDTYMRAYPVVNGQGVRETDLFEGVSITGENHGH